MALTEYEKKVLEQMEASLREEDPALASHMSTSAPEKDAEPARGPRAPRRIALGFGGAVLGMVVLVGAVSLGYSLVSILLGVVGFALTVVRHDRCPTRPPRSPTVLRHRGSDVGTAGGDLDVRVRTSRE